MKLCEFETDNKKDKVEITKQQQAEIQKVFDSRIIPHENHTLFEIDLKKGTIERAEFKLPNTVIHWFEALENYRKKVIKKVDIYNAKTVTKSEVIKKENYLYISALNKENVIKILERDYNIKL